MLIFLIYLSGAVTNISLTSTMLAGILGVCALATGGASLDAYGESKEQYRKCSKTLFRWFFVPLIISVITPSKESMYLMLAAYAGSEIAQMESVQGTASKSMQALDKYLTDYLEDVTPAEEE